MTKVFLLTIDAFRFDQLNHEDTPFLCKLKKGGLSFNQAISTGSGTSSSFPGILAGVLPLDYGYAKLREEHSLIPQELSENCYTVGISSSTPTSHIYNYNKGFDEFYDNEHSSFVSRIKTKAQSLSIIKDNDFLYNAGKRLVQAAEQSGQVPYVTADEVTEMIISELGDGPSKGQDMFLWAHYMDTHTPYHPPEEYLPKDADPTHAVSEANTLLNQYNRNTPPVYGERDGKGIEISDELMNSLYYYYRAEARFLDDEIKKAVQAIERDCDDFFVIICADHGEEFGEHGHHGHRPKMYEELIHVPLIIHSSRFDEGRDVSTPVSLLNIPPTVTDILGVEGAPNWRGESLIDYSEGSDDEEGTPVISELSHTTDEGLGGSVQPEKALICVRGFKLKYIHNRQSGTHQLFDLEADFSETNNIISEISKKGGGLRTLAESRMNELSRSEMDMSDDVEERLAELGYIER